jgi:hypothetical protein
MKKIIFSLVFVIVSWCSVEMNAQVTIGDLKDPHNGAVLDLQSSKLGLLLPNVFLNNVKVFQLCTASADINTAEGMVVFNTNPDLAGSNGKGKGIYIWYDNQWNPLYNDCCCPQEEDFTIDGPTTVQVGATITLTADKPVAWEVDGSTTYGNIASSTAVDCVVRGVQAGGTVTIKATHNGVSKSWIVTVTAVPCSSSDYLVTNGAYAPISANKYTGNTGATGATVLASGTFTNVGSLCVRSVYYGAVPKWSSANNACTGDWRIPNLAELANLNKQGADYFTGHGMDLKTRYWSSTLTNTANTHWYFIFDESASKKNGEALISPVPDDQATQNINLRCVRTI